MRRYMMNMTAPLMVLMTVMGAALRAQSANQPPSIGVVSVPAFNAGTATSCVLPAATDPEGDAITYSATGLPSGMTFTPATRTVSGTVSTGGSYAFTYMAMDSKGASTNKVVGLTVNASASAITSFSASPNAINAGQPSTLNWALNQSGLSLSVDQGVGTVTGTSRAVTPAATTTYTLSASSGAASVPALRQAYATVNTKSQTGVNVQAGDLIVVMWACGNSNGPTTCSDNANGGSNTYSECGTGADYRTSSLSMRAFYAVAKAAETLTVTISTVNSAGGIYVNVYSGTDSTLANVLRGYSFDVVEGSSTTSHTSASIAAQPNDLIVVFWFQNYAGSTFSENGSGFTERSETSSSYYGATYDRVVSTGGSYANSVTSTSSLIAGNVVMAFKAKAAAGSSATAMCTVVVNQPPAFGAVTVPSPNAGTAVNCVLAAATDPEGDAITYSTTGLPSGLTFDAATRTLSGTAPATGNYTFTYTGTDARGAAASTAVTLSVNTTASGAITSFIASRPLINRGESSTLNWTVSGSGLSLSLDQGIGTVTGTSRSVSPVVNTTYTLTAANSGSDPSLRQAYTTFGQTQTGVSVQAGDLIVVMWAAGHSNDVTTCADSASGGGNSYSECGSGADYATSGLSMRAFYAIAKATETLSITISSVNTTGGIYVNVYSGTDQTLASVLRGYSFDGVEGSSSGSHTSASVAAQPSDLVVAFWSQNYAGSTFNENGTGFTKRSEMNGPWYGATYDRVVTSPGTYSDSVTSTSDVICGNVVMAFKVAPSAQPVSATCTVLVNQPPVIGVVPSLSVQTGRTVNVTLPAATDAENQSITYQVLGLPSGLVFNGSTRLLTGTFAAQGTYLLTYRATDTGGAITNVAFTATVSERSTSLLDVTTTINYGYYNNGLLRTITYPSGRVVEYGYDNLDRVIQVTQNGQAVIRNIPNQYDAWGNLAARRYGSYASDSWIYDGQGIGKGLLLSQWTTTAVGATPQPRDYSYDAADRMTRAGDWETLVYDVNSRLTKAVAPAFGISNDLDHDAFNNNIKSKSTGSLPSTMISFEFNPMPENHIPGLSKNSYGQLSDPTGVEENSFGEITQLGTTVPYTQTFTMFWDALGRMESTNYTSPGGRAKESHQYAGSGLRVTRIDSLNPSLNRLYAYTGAGQLLSEYTANPALAWKKDVIYIGSLAIAEADANGVHELHSDHQGTPRMVTNSAGAVEGTQAYGPYGESITAATSGYVPLTGYTGHIQTEPTGLIYMRGRFYSPTWHRFMNSDQGVDPNNINQFAYVGGDPISGTDPSGYYEPIETSDGRELGISTDRSGTSHAINTGNDFSSDEMRDINNCLSGGKSFMGDNSGDSWNPFASAGHNAWTTKLAEWFGKPAMPPQSDVGTAVKSMPPNSTSIPGTNTGMLAEAAIGLGVPIGQMTGNAIVSAALAPLTRAQARQLAATLGFQETKSPPFKPHGQPVFKNGGKFITPDKDMHKGGTWKVFDRNGKRLGTYNDDLTTRIGD